MVKQRARLNDENDPLSSTDRVLAGFEQFSQSRKKSISLEPDNSESQQADNLASEKVVSIESQQADNLASQQSNGLSSAPSSQLLEDEQFQEVSKLETQEVNYTALQESRQLNNNLESQEVGKPGSQQYIVSSSQQVSNTLTSQSDLLDCQPAQTIFPLPAEAIKLRKSTFQISETVLHKLDQLHLTLQLELGKAKAPYKEVIVEEALVRLLEEVINERSTLIDAFIQRQKSRDKI